MSQTDPDTESHLADDARWLSDQPAPAPPRSGRRLLPLVLFLATCASTYATGGPQFCIALMITLTAHEMGHFLQARRYHVAASLPYFIPMPLSPIVGFTPTPFIM